jgi:hypothetical protein
MDSGNGLIYKVRIMLWPSIITQKLIHFMQMTVCILFKLVLFVYS